MGESLRRAGYFEAGAELAVEAGAEPEGAGVDDAGVALFESAEDADVDSDVFAEEVDFDFDAALLSVR